VVFGAEAIWLGSGFTNAGSVVRVRARDSPQAKQPARVTRLVQLEGSAQNVTRHELENYVVKVEQERRWFYVATVWLMREEAAGGPVRLVSVRALTRRGARRRAARVIDLRQRLASGSPAA
jgi:hypothetical protein